MDKTQSCQSGDAVDADTAEDSDGAAIQDAADRLVDWPKETVNQSAMVESWATLAASSAA